MQLDNAVEMLGQIGRCTGTIAPGTIGEVSIAIRGGTETFYAYPADGVEVIEKGARIAVVEFEPPRVVRVTRLPS